MNPASLWQLKKWKVFQVLHSTTPLSRPLHIRLRSAVTPARTQTIFWFAIASPCSFDLSNLGRRLRKSRKT